MLNLLSNAIKLTPQGDAIVIKVGWTQAGGQYLSVKDNGPGIPEAEIPVAMASFGRGSMAQKNADEGSGLGLPIVKGLVEMHGGTFFLRSKVREGTEAVVILPPERVMIALPLLDPDQPAPAAARRSTRPVAAQGLPYSYCTCCRWLFQRHIAEMMATDTAIAVWANSGTCSWKVPMYVATLLIQKSTCASQDETQGTDMRSAVRKMGNSSGIILPKPFLEEIGSKAGDEVELRVEAGRIVISPLPAPPRASWTADALRVAADGEAPAWPEFGNEDDAALTW